MFAPGGAFGPPANPQVRAGVTASDGNVPLMQPMSKTYPWFTRGDMDSYPMLLLDNLSSLVGILGAILGVPYILSMDADYIAAWEDMVYMKICPAVAFALVFGNLYYAWMARKLAGYQGNDNVTALPYGINTPAGFIVAFDIMLLVAGRYWFAFDSNGNHVYGPTELATICWQSACAVNFCCGLFEMAGFWIGPLLRRNLSKAALYGPITCVGFVWLAMVPVIEVGTEPLIGMVPLACMFLAFFANKGKGVYGKIPGAFLILVMGIALKWSNLGRYNRQYTSFLPSGTLIGWSGTTRTTAEPNPFFGYLYGDDANATVAYNYNGHGSAAYFSEHAGNMWDTYAGKNGLMPFVAISRWTEAADFIMIAVPIAIQSFVETMENVEAACSVGDHYPLMECMLVDGFGTLLGAVMGCPLPTTVYIGHTRHKAIGASGGYSLLNAATFFVMLMAGLLPWIMAILDPVSIGVILIAVGLMIVQHAFECSAPRHYPAICVALMFGICDWARFDVTSPGVQSFAAGSGVMASVIITQIVCDLIDMRFVRCLGYTLLAMVFSLFGIMHGNNSYGVSGEGSKPCDSAYNDDCLIFGQLTLAIKRPVVRDAHGIQAHNVIGDVVNEGWRFTIAYAMLAGFLLIHVALQQQGLIDPPIIDDGGSETFAGVTAVPKEDDGSVELVKEMPAEITALEDPKDRSEA